MLRHLVTRLSVMTDMCVTIDVLEAGRQHSEQVMVLRGFFWGGEVHLPDQWVVLM